MREGVPGDDEANAGQVGSRSRPSEIFVIDTTPRFNGGAWCCARGKLWPRSGLWSAGNPLSTNTRRAASIMRMYLRLILVSSLSLAAIACPVLCADSSAPHGSHNTPCSPDGHNRPCDNSCFCSSAATQQSSWRLVLETGFTFAPIATNVCSPIAPVPDGASILPLLVIIQLGSSAGPSLPLLI